MGFKKGTSGNPKGRPKGAKGKNSDVRKWLLESLQDGQERFAECLAVLDPPDYIKAYMAMMAYAVAKPQSISPVELMQAEYDALARLLNAAPDEVVAELEKRITILSERWKERKQ